MSIKFHCEHCGKKIDAPDTAGGKRGKCPSCHNIVYVPQMDTEDELTLAPIDESEAERKKRLMAETSLLTQNILQEKEVPEGSAPAATETDGAEAEVAQIIIRYLRQMADGDLDAAQGTAQAIAAHRKQAKAVLEEMVASDPLVPELPDVPAQVLSGLIRNLRTRIA